MKNVCETPEEHEGVIKAALAAMPSDDAIVVMAARFNLQYI